ncbi:MAG: hypothetical protein ACTSRZ_16020 [Promethearchaeota archaeon]
MKKIRENESATTSKLIIHLPEKLWLGKICCEYPFQFQILSFISINQNSFIGNSLISIIGTNPS